jgi:CheY-like chemotaxis protein
MSKKIGGQVLYLLIVDTNAHERFTMGMLLQRFGYTVCIASNVREGIEFLCVAQAAAIFAEAGAIGSDLLARLEGDARFRGVPVVLTSEQRDRGLEEQVRSGKIAGLVKLPLSINEVYQVIQKVIERGSRTNIRISTSLPAKLVHGPETTTGHVTVLSQYGMFFRTLAPPPVGARIIVDFSLWDRTVSLDAVVLYVVSFEEGPFSEPGMGLKFVRISPEDNDMVRAFIHDQIWDGLAPLDPGRGYRGGQA